MGYEGSSSSAFRILKHLGFKHRKINNRYKFLMERSGIVVAWFMFLHKKHQIRVSGNKHLVFYLDETWDSEPHMKIHLSRLHK
jgi:hypothetical protein